MASGRTDAGAIRRPLISRVRLAEFALSALLVLLAFAWLGATQARAGTLWIEDWSTHSIDKWYTHTYSAPIDQYSFVADGAGNDAIVMHGDSWGIESRQSFNKNTPISVESLVKAQPVGPHAAETQYFAGITIYNGESGYEEIALINNLDSDQGLQVCSVVNNVTTMLPDGQGFLNHNLPSDQFYRLRLDYDGRGTWRYYVNGLLLYTHNGSTLGSNANIFLLSVANNSCTYLNNCPNNNTHGYYLVESTFKEVDVRANYNLFGNTTWVNFLNQANTKVATEGSAEECGAFIQCDFLQLHDGAAPPSHQYGQITGIWPAIRGDGHTISPVINLADMPPGLRRWGEVLTTTALDGQRISIQVLNPDESLVGDQFLPGNSAGFTGNSVNLSGLDPAVFPSLKLQANFTSFEPYAKTPRLLDWSLTLSDRSYFTWYDQLSPGMKDWLLTSHPANFSGEAHFSALLGSGPTARTGYAAVPHGKAAYTTWPGAMDGPLEVTNLSGTPDVISQRVLYGNSLEETLAVDETRLSSHYYWPWYDQLSAGFKNWILIANPNTENVRAEIWIDGIQMENPASTSFPKEKFFDIQPGKNVTPQFPGVIGGVVEVRAYRGPALPGLPGDWNNLSDRRNVIASQRVTTGDGIAFNEGPGIPAEELADHYYWTWYDNFSVGAKNWVLVANPNADAVTYEISIAGNVVDSGTLQPGDQVTPTFKDVMGGPVEVQAWDAVTHSPAKIIASQRAIWGDSFEEVPGYPEQVAASGSRPAVGLSPDYQWTWYDNFSAGASNWVVVANLENEPVIAEIYVGGVLRGNYLLGAKGTPNAMRPAKYDGLIGGPVEVRAYTQGGSWQNLTDRRNVLASQRVLWNGFFNEVEGTVLDLD